jgi:hypothetical protein
VIVQGLPLNLTIIPRDFEEIFDAEESLPLICNAPDSPNLLDYETLALLDNDSNIPIANSSYEVSIDGGDIPPGLTLVPASLKLKLVDSPAIEKAIARKLNLLSQDDQRTFRSLHDNTPSASCPLTSIAKNYPIPLCLHRHLAQRNVYLGSFARPPRSI